MRAQGRAPGCARAQGVRHELRFGAGQRGAARRSALRSPVRRHGRRWIRRPHSGASTRVRKRRPGTWCSFLLATVGASHKATAGSRRRGCPRHGGERRRRHEKGAKGPALPSRLQRTRAAVHTCERRGPHGRARGHAATGTRCGRADTTRRRPNGRRPTARGVG
jgi:hypothetical protein